MPVRHPPNAVELVACCWALLPLVCALCTQLDAVPDACRAPRTRVADLACGAGPQALQGADRLLFGGRLDPNRASPEALTLLPGIGPVRADAIARGRAEEPFARLEDLERVRGIGPRTVHRLEAWLSVEPGIADRWRSRPP